VEFCTAVDVIITRTEAILTEMEIEENHEIINRYKNQ
jgi:hypothetical protein